jgi:CRISPR-associated protein Cmr4
LVGLAQASIERYKKDERDKVGDRMDKAQDVLDAVLKGSDTLPGIAGKPLQIGGDASTGRGLVIVQTVAKQ